MTDPIAEEYRSSLSELNFNSKPHINMLTMLAEENAPHAAVIVQTIVDHINSVTPDIKLPSLYLVDSIAKNIGKVYIPLFSKHLVALFTSVFEKVDENIRSLLYKLRQTWTGLFPNNVLLQLDRSVVCLDPAWPILAKPQIHFNPKFLKDKAPVQLPEIEEPPPSPSPVPQNTSLEEVEMKKRQLLLLQALHQKKKELITLQLKKALASPTISDGVKEDAKKIINTRDPRLSKKMTSTTQSDSAVLQSVVVIPKVNKRNEKEPTTSSSKKIKLDSDSSPKKDLKNKSESMEVESGSKLNVELNTQIASSISAQVQNGDRSKKQSFSSENSSELITKSPLQQNTDFNKESLPVNSLPARQNELIKIKNNIVSQTSVNEENKYLFKSQPVVMTNEDTCHKNIQKLDSPPSPPLFLGNEDRDYRMLPKNINERSLKESSYSKRPAVPVVKSFILDKKERKVYFVNDRSFALMDDNVPKELTFEGPPKLVFIEGLTQPIELAFGQEVEFEVDGKCNFMKFGTPSREVYINDYPFEAQFGGSSFTAMLSNGKVHRIHISGPPPHVVLSESPSYELYEKFCQNNKEFLCKLDNESSITNDDLSTDTTVGTRDVDMRMNNVKSSSTFFHFPLERMQNVDWQRIPVDNMQQAKWNVPKNSFESFKDVEQNFTVPKTYSQGPEWQNPHPLPEIQSAPLNPPPLPPKQMINRFPLPPHTYRNIDVNNTISMNQFSMNEHPRLLPPCNVEQPRFTANSVEQHIFLPPNNVPFSQANFSGNEFSVNRPDLNMVINCTIPRLSPPPLPPFIGPIQNASGVPNVSSASTSTPYSNPVSSAPLHPAPIFSSSPLLATPVVVSSSPLLPTPTSAPLINLPSLQPMTRLSAPLPINNFINTTQVPSYTVPENVPRFTATPSSTAPSATSATSDMQLFMEKLKAAGLIKSDLSTSSTPVSTASTTSEPETKEEEKKDELPKEQTIPEITFDSKCLREYHPGVIAAIYCGSMCATCGIRFKEIQSEQYSRHLDWHFRRNRREKDGAKKPFSRRWFYEIKDWIEFKEFEDKDERAPSYFELQANSEQIEEEPENVCSVSCSECDSEICAVCDEQFQLFWVEEAEEWHLRNCVKHDDQVYHPACYEDFKKANEPVPDAEMSFDDSTIDIKPTDSTTDNKPDVAELNLDVKVKTEVMDVDINIKTEMMDIDSDIKQEPMDVNDNVIKKDVQPILGKKSEMIDSGMKSKIEKLKLGEKTVIKKLNSKETQIEVAEHSRNKVVKLVENKVKKEVKIKEVKPSEIKEIKPSEMKEVKPSEIKEVKPSEIKTIKEVKSTEIKSDKNKIGKEVKSTEVKLNDHKAAKVVKSTEIKTNQNKIITEVKISEVKPNESKIVKEVKNTEVKQNESKIVKEVKNTDVKQNESKIVKEVKNTEVKPNENKVVKEVKSTEVKSNENKVVNEMKINEVKLNENKIVEVKVKEVKSDENRIVKEVTKNVKLEKQEGEKTEKIEENKIEKEVRTEEKKVEETKSQEVLDGKCDKRIEKIPTESMTSEKAKEPPETIKEPVKGDETHTDIKNNFKTDISSSETNSNVSPTVSSKTDVKSQSSSHSETVPTKPEDELEDIEFRPPTPDPRFEVLPPVSRGTEISNLCTIM